MNCSAIALVLLTFHLCKGTSRTMDNYLETAIRNGREDVCELLFYKYADVNAQNHHGKTPLMKAIAENSRQCFDAIMNHKKIEVDLKDDRDSTALHYASKTGDEQMCVELAQIADVNATDVQGTTPLMLAADRNRLDCVRALLANKAKIEEKNEEGETALSMAKQKGFEIIVEVLESEQMKRNKAAKIEEQKKKAKTVDDTPFIHVSRSKQQEHVADKADFFIEKLIMLELERSDRGFEKRLGQNAKEIWKTLLVNPDSDKMKAFVKALEEEKLLVVKEKLVEQEFKKRLGQNAKEIWKILIKPDSDKMKAFVEALEEELLVRSNQMKEKLVDKDPLTKNKQRGCKNIASTQNEMNKQLWSAIQDGGEVYDIHAQKSSREKCEALLNNGADVNAEVEGKTPLMNAIIDKNKGCFDVIMKHEKIKVNLCDKEGWTALHHAARAHNDPDEYMCIELAQRADVNVNVVAGNGITPLMLAVARKKSKCVRELNAKNADQEATVSIKTDTFDALSIAKIKEALDIVGMLDPEHYKLD